MHINGVRPALYCGKDTVFYQCMKCGNETTARVPAVEEASSGDGEMPWLSLK